MKTRLNALTKYFVTMSKRLGVNKDWQHALRSERSAMNYFNRVIIVLLGKSGRTWILGSLAFARFCINLRKHSGLKGLAIVLKVSATALIKCVAGSPLKNSLALGHRVAFTNSGLLLVIIRGSHLRGTAGAEYIPRFSIILKNIGINFR